MTISMRPDMLKRIQDGMLVAEIPVADIAAATYEGVE